MNDPIWHENPMINRIAQAAANGQLESQQNAIAMETATAGETCNRLDPKDDSAGRSRHRPNTVATQPTGEGSQ